MAIVRPFIDRPRLTALTIMLAVVAGLAGIFTLPRQEDPVPRERFASVLTALPGASAARIESLITVPLEDAVREVGEVKEIKSFSRVGISVVIVELADDVTKTDEVWAIVRNKIGDAEPLLPANAAKPQLDVRLLPAVTLLVGLYDSPGADVPLGVLSRLAEQLGTRLYNVPGTEKLEIFGEPTEEFRVTLDPLAAASVGVTAGQVSAALANADAKQPAGLLRDNDVTLIVEVAGELSSLERIRQVPLATGANGRTLRVGDVARVEKTIQDPPSNLAFLSGNRGVALAVTMQPNRRVDIWAEQARQVVSKFEAELPETVIIDTIVDQSVYTQNRLADLAGNFLIAVALVIAILYVLMGWRSALLVGLSLPLSVCIVLGALTLLNVPLHQMSVTGAIIALGLLIDNAIVVVDDYNLLRRRGARRAEAARKAVHHLQVPLFASTLTTALTFAPIMLMPGGAGDFVGTMALTVILAIFSSLFVSLTIIPALATFVDKKEASQSAVEGATGIDAPKLAKAYRSLLDKVIARPGRTALLCLLVPFFGFFSAGQLEEQFFPPVDRDQFQIQVSLPSDSPIEETLATVEHVNAILARYGEDIVSRHWFVGESPPKAFYNIILNNESVPSFAAAIINTASADTTERLLPILQNVVMDEVTNAEVLVLAFDQGPPIPAPVEVRVLGDNLEDLRRVGEQVRQVMGESKNITFTRAQISGGRPKLLLNVDENAAATAGVALTDLTLSLRNDLEGAVGGSVLEEREELPVRVRLGEDVRADFAGLMAQPVLRQGAAASQNARLSANSQLPIPLSAIATPTLVPEAATIARFDRERVNEVQAFVTPFTLPSVALADFQARLEAADIPLPPGVRLQFGGEAETQSSALGNLMSSVGILMTLMVGTVILTFNSFRMAGIILSVAVLSVGIAFIPLFVFGQPRGFMAIIGTMGLIGLAINGAIVVLSSLRAEAKAAIADPDAIRETVVDCTRHIVGTTMTTIAGFLPLLIWGDKFWTPLSLAVAGGVLGSSVLALIYVPAMFTLVARAKVRKQIAREEGELREALLARLGRIISGEKRPIAKASARPALDTAAE